MSAWFPIGTPKTSLERQGYNQEEAVNHQQRGHDSKAAAQFNQRTRSGNDADRSYDDRDLEQRLREIEIRIALGSMITFGFPFPGLGEQLLFALAGRRVAFVAFGSGTIAPDCFPELVL